ncbi:unnamed protein product [Bursaphelenchus okinawaensis]|uniref:Uncharacterized protein n=1 Tax=Bursaphelenchus okinawaensis TaxID=465554 RepID=A0A811KW12_9BILA|nr:unnamed protein product [Bursaphelenchus okinawaensis]CAG9112842.1 unnamed protein product [Bursaphelenchus okinawaensis]
MASRTSYKDSRSMSTSRCFFGRVVLGGVPQRRGESSSAILNRVNKAGSAMKIDSATDFRDQVLRNNVFDFC